MAWNDWNNPLFIIVAFATAMGIATWLIRAASAQRETMDFECLVCGRKKNRLPLAKEWRYCPYCGVPKDVRRLGNLRR